MKTILICLLALCAGIGTVRAQEKKDSAAVTYSLHGNPEVYAFVQKTGVISSNVTAYAFMQVAKHWAVSAYFLIENDKDPNGTGGEGIFGPTYLSHGLEAGVLVGLETGTKMWRLSPWFLLRSKNDKFVFLAVYETGASGSGFRGEAWQTFKKFGKWELRGGGIDHIYRVGPAIKLVYKKTYIFSCPYMFSWNKEEGPAALIGIGAEL